MQRIFLGWGRPCLQTASEFLCDRFVQAGRFDLRNVLIALPSSRAISRLQEILLEQVESLIESGQVQADWFPPCFLTIGHLFEELYPQTQPLAKDILQQLTWIDALDRFQQESPDILARVLPQSPEKNDWNMRFSLAKLFSQVHCELAEELLNFKDVAEKCRELGITEEATRWDALAELQQRYHDKLDSLGHWDVQSARSYAIKHKELQTTKQIVLIGVVDMNRAQKIMLDHVTKQVMTFIFAPESLKQHFDKYGCVVASQWKETPIEIQDEQIEMVDTPSDQGIAAAVWVANKTSLTGKPESFDAESIVLGVPSEELIPFIQQQFQQAEIKTRVVAGRPAQQTAPYKFLEVLARFVRTRQYADFADLLRFPIVEKWLNQDGAPSCSLLTASDEYYTEFLPGTIENGIITNGTIAGRKESQKELLWTLWKKLETILQPFLRNEKQGLRTVVQTFCADEDDYFGKRTVEAIKNIFEELDDLPDDITFTPQPEELVELLLRQLQPLRIAAPAEKDAIEILGWLELVLDDTPFLVVTGLNEGIVPSSLSADLFLPEKLRGKLQLEDNDRRLARDTYALSALLAVRQHKGAVHLIAGRQSATGDPILPSRLFFATDPKTPEIMANRVVRFFSVEEKRHPVIFPGTLRSELSESAFRPPQPRPLTRPVDSMRITEFRDYLTCPYRYYLKHILKLDTLRDSDEELNAAQFGTLLHEVLHHFGKGPVRHSDSPEKIANELNRLLDEWTARQYGQSPRAALAVQREQLRYRLNAFANWQANWTTQGHRIVHTELKLDVDQQIEGKPIRAFLEIDRETRITLRGRIDRIDFHAETGTWYLFDYKSSDSAKSPDQVHRQKGNWVDLQLPLYRHVIKQSLAQSLPDIPFDKLQTGYIVLPKDVSKTGALIAEWREEDYADAIDAAKEVVRKIRAEQFGPEFMSRIPSRFSDIYAAICGS